MDIKAYFKNYVNNIAYLEIDKDYYIKGVNLKGLPLPVRVQDLVDNLKNEKLTENVNFEIFSIGMLYNIGIDEDFKYNREYIKILSKIYENILKLIFNIIFQLKENNTEIKKMNENLLILYHAAYIIRPDDELAIYGYGTELSRPKSWTAARSAWRLWRTGWKAPSIWTPCWKPCPTCPARQSRTAGPGFRKFASATPGTGPSVFTTRRICAACARPEPNWCPFRLWRM